MIGVLALLIAAGVAAGVVAGSNEDDDQASSVTRTTAERPETTTTTGTEQAAADGLAPTCLPVAQYLLDALGVPGAVAVRASDDVHLRPNGSDTVWYVSDPQGATWATNLDPEAEDASGLTVPLNDAARATSDLGTDLPPDAFADVDVNSAEARESRVCATDD